MERVIDLKNGKLIVEDNNTLNELCNYGSRINNKRGFLFVSKVMGKHLPISPEIMDKTFKQLGKKVSDLNLQGNTLFIGFAETATCLSQGIFFNSHVNGQKAYISTTRYIYENKEIFINFEEEHSHATAQILYNLNDLFDGEIDNIIILDDEFTTGKTLDNIIIKLKEKLPNVQRYIGVSILNWIPENANLLCQDFLYLYKGNFEFVKNDVIYKENTNQIPNIITHKSKEYMCRFGCKDKHTSLNFINNNIHKILNNIYFNDRILIIGSGEFMYIPFLIALKIERMGYKISYQATTRSPINIDGCITNKETFIDNYGEGINNYLYNLVEYDKIFVLVEEENEIFHNEISKILSKYARQYKIIEV